MNRILTSHQDLSTLFLASLKSPETKIAGVELAESLN